MGSSNNKLTDLKRIAFLDYLRIFAFASVLTGHKFYDYIVAISNDPTMHSTPKVIANILLPLLQGGGAGVIVFFLVSGYIITHVLQTEHTVEFLIKRTFRIYPLYIVAVLSQYVTLAIDGNAPSLSILFPQLLLVGDFFDTPLALNGVEWTLRAEVVFYVFMSTLSYLNLMSNHNKILPYILIGTTLLCGYIAPIPSANIWTKGYFTIYSPFLLLGSMFYLFEKKQIRLTILSFFIGLVFYQYYSLIAIYQKNWLDAHFAILAFLIFTLSWAFRGYITATSWILLLSDMTFSVYLFHNWLFDYIKNVLGKLNVSVLNSDIQSLIILMILCYYLVKYIEKPGIKFGRSMLTKYINRRFSANQQLQS